jgi:hypothetical protein
MDEGSENTVNEIKTAERKRKRDLIVSQLKWLTLMYIFFLMSLQIMMKVIPEMY